MKKIEVNLGIGLNMFFPEPVVIEIPDNVIFVEELVKSYEKYLEFVKTFEEPDYDYLVDDPNEYKLREFTLEEFVNVWESNDEFQQKFQ
jgi:hypothetical protein